MQILFVEPFYADSHKQWLDGLINHSKHQITKLVLPGKFWKWRMHGGAITLAFEFKKLNYKPDLVVCSSMLDLTTFTSLLRKELAEIPIAIYFHENQISYPWSPSDEDIKLKRDRHYGFINYASTLAADSVIFNSYYHLNSFLESLPDFLKAFPDYQNAFTIDDIKSKSSVLPLGFEFEKIDAQRVEKQNVKPILLWNHRWEFDKNPELFFETLISLDKQGFDFELIVLGRQYPKYPKIFDRAKEKLTRKILHWGYAESEEEYHRLLWKADILPVTSIQDFFGISVIEAIYCNTFPLFPNRLAYPEHIEDEKHFYDSAEDFRQKLKSAMSNFPNLSLPSLKKIHTYNWKEIIIQYDRYFESL